MKNKSPLDDPIVEEVRKRGMEYAARFDYDLDKMVLDLRLRQQARGKEVVSFSRESPSGDLNQPKPRRRSSH
jgi:hypothetical protein